MSVVAPSFMKGPSKFGDPFLLPSSSSFPADIKSTLDMCLYLYRINRIYGAVCNRVVSYFITDIEFDDEANTNEITELREVLTETLQVFAKMQQAGQEWAIYGNGFIRCVEPFDRWLIDDRDGEYRAIALDTFPDHMVQYNYEDLTYTVPDLKALARIPKDHRSAANVPQVALKFKDKPSAALDKFSIIFLDPRYIELDQAHHANSIEYIYRLPPDMESRIKAGKLHQVNNTPRGLLEAAAQNKDFKFHRGEVYHFKGPSPTGVSDSGWGVPEILLHYDSLYQLQVYRKADFAIAQDFLTPLRVFTPNFGDKVGDSVLTMLMSRWRGEMSNMIATRRKDPTAMHALPFDANYHEYGGDGKRMVMYDVVEAYTDQLFDGLGFPRELFRGTLNPEQLPNAIRMFERHYEWLFQALNGMLKFISNTLQRAKDSKEISCKLKRPSMAYNAEWMQLRMQLAANREIPRESIYPDVGISDPVAAAAKARKEDQEIERRSAEDAARFEKERNQGSMADVALIAAEQGVMPAQEGGAPPAGGGAGPVDFSVDPDSNPAMVQQRAEELAQRWITMHAEMPNSHRKEMSQAEATNPTLYAAAKQAMEEMRSGAASAGRAQTAQMIAPQ